MRKISNKIILIISLISIIGLFQGCSEREVTIHQEIVSPMEFTLPMLTALKVELQHHLIK